MDKTTGSSHPTEPVEGQSFGLAVPAASGSSPEEEPARRRLRIVLQILALAVITVGSYWLAVNEELVLRFSHLGYASSFLITLISNATVILPAPGMVVVMALGASLNPVLLGITAGCGSALGELSGYLAGKTGGELIGKKGVHAKLRDLTARYTMPVLFLLSILPTPLFDVAGILAGAMGLPIHRFLIPVTAGKIIKHIVFALAGAEALPLLKGLLGL